MIPITIYLLGIAFMLLYYLIQFLEGKGDSIIVALFNTAMWPWLVIKQLWMIFCFIIKTLID